MRVLVVLLLLSIASCARTLQTPLLLEAFPKTLRSQVTISDVPFYPQQQYQCGPAALAMMLSWNGAESSAEELTPIVFSPEAKGSFQHALVGAARRRGMLAYPLAPEMRDLLEELNAGHPVLVFLNLGLSWYPVWHYAVAVGYNIETKTIYLHSGAEQRDPVDLLTFEHLWRRAEYWGLLVLKPGTLPQIVDKASYLEAAAALERVAQGDVAIRAFEAAHQKWPDDEATIIGFTNALLENGQLAAAEKILSRAVLKEPYSAALLNNYADLLASQKRWSDALVYATRASLMLSEYRETCLRTLEQIESSKKQPWSSRTTN